PTALRKFQSVVGAAVARGGRIIAAKWMTFAVTSICSACAVNATNAGTKGLNWTPGCMNTLPVTAAAAGNMSAAADGRPSAVSTRLAVISTVLDWSRGENTAAMPTPGMVVATGSTIARLTSLPLP